jgi:hypothetical protein
MAIQNDNTALSLSVQARFASSSSGGNAQVAATAYVFNSEATLLASADLGSKGEARLNIQTPVRADTLRVVVGPRVEDKRADFAELMRRGAIEQHVAYRPGVRELSAQLTVFEPIWQCWLRSAVFVQGQLLKQVPIGGQNVDFPVCQATVEIYEVDPLYILIPKLPPLVLERLRDIIAHARIPEPIASWPGRLPGPIPEPGPDPLPLSVTGAALRRLGRTTLAAQGLARSHALTSDSAATLTKLTEATELRYLAQAGSTLQFQQALIQNPVLVRPLLCWLYPHFVTMQRVGTAVTDSCGHFRALFFQGCANHDTPDLYFKATQQVWGPLRATIYAPTPVACHTWWDYVSGTEVKLYTRSPLAHTCAPCPPVQGPGGVSRWVAFLAIGGVPLSQIYGTSKRLQDTRPAAEVAARLGLTSEGRPWGGLLRPRLLFANELEALGVKHYQVSWRRGSSGPFQPLQDGIQHYYRHDVATPSGTFPAWTPYTLGPKPVARGDGTFVPDLTQIPYPSVAPEGVWDTPPSAGEILEHLSSAKFPSHLLMPGLSYQADGAIVPGTSDESGKVQIKVDLFDAQGAPIDIAALGIRFVVPDVPDLSGTIMTTDAQPLGLVVGNSMVITLHVDNNHCFAQLPAPSVGSTYADECCGVLQVQDGDLVSLPYQAWHPHVFARYSFVTVRGTRTVLARNQDPADPGRAPSVDNPDTGLVNEDPFGGSPAGMTAHELMTVNLPADCSTGGCLVAGFSENLYVDSTATDGWHSELGYDASAVRAFVLSKVALPTS